MAAEPLVIVNGRTLVYVAMGPMKGHFFDVSQADAEAGVTAGYFINGFSMQKPLLLSDIYTPPAAGAATTTALNAFDAWYRTTMPQPIQPYLYERPTVTSINPSTAASAAADVEVTVTGTKYDDWTVVTVQGIDQETTFVDSTHVKFMMNPDGFGAAGAKVVRARNGELISTTSANFTVT